jgi:hypothetical protein
MRQFIRTDQGSGWVQAEPIVSSGSIFISRRLVKLQREGRMTELPAGTPFVYSRDLERRTRDKPRDERRSHLIVEEGLHSVERLCHYVRSSERADHRVMVERHGDVARVAKELFECGQLSFEDHEMITKFIESIRSSFDERKTNENKVTVRRRLDTTNEQRSRAGRFKPAPAALTAYASTAHIRKRLAENKSIHAAFSSHAIEVNARLEETKQLTSAMWIELKEDGPATINIRRAMDRIARSRVVVNIALISIRTLWDHAQAITAQPYRPLAAELGIAFGDLAHAVQAHRRAAADAAEERALMILRRMRMLWFIERSLIHLLSFLPDDGTVPHDLMDRFRARFDGAEKRVADLGDAEFDPELRKLVAEYLEATRTNLNNGDYDKARDELKHLTHELRVQPINVPARRKAA